jgi:hypothetical protein
MNKLNITQGEWSAVNHLDVTDDFCIHSQGTKICELPNLSKENQANAKLIADAGTTYNTTPILPSELLKQRNELLDALRVMLDGSNAPEWKKEMALKTIKNCNNA